MDILLDTHVYLWFIAGDNRLSACSREAIEDLDNLKIVSVASLWEITIKHSLGKLVLKTDLHDIVFAHIVDNGFDLLPIESGHLLHLSNLPLHHRDPFDRLLVAQCRSDELTICTADPAFKAYDISVLW